MSFFFPRFYGPIGPLFNVTNWNIFSAWERLWERERAAQPSEHLPPFREGILEYLTPPRIWYSELGVLVQHLRMDRELVATFWDELGPCFRPAFPNFAKWREDARSLQIGGEFMKSFVAISSSQVADAMSTVVRTASFGPYTLDEMGYICQHHTRTFEVGAGSGYLIACLRDKGVDARGVDTNAYTARQPTESGITERGIMDECAWSLDLRRDGRLWEGGTDALPQSCDDVTLIISWPPAGSAFPGEALETFRCRGGKRFLFKLGAYVAPSQIDANYGGESDPIKAGRNVAYFLTELVNFWGPSCSPPPYNPLLVFNSLWAFDLKAAN